jgi:hypothetical protein
MMLVSNGEVIVECMCVCWIVHHLVDPPL